MFDYTAFGLNIRSEFPLPELVPALGQGGEATVFIRAGLVPEALEQPEAGGVLYQVNARQFLLKMDGIADYLVEGGHEITVQPASRGKEGEMRLFLLGSVLGALLHQRGALVLHGSGVAVPSQGEKRAVLFTGRSGTGKSTLAAALRLQGFPVIADDKCAIVPGNGHLQAYPGFPRIMLWEDAARKLAIPTQALERARAELEKYSVSVEDGFPTGPMPLWAIYLLQTHNDSKIELSPVHDDEKYPLILRNTFRRKFLVGPGMRQAHHELACAVASQVRVVGVKRPIHPFLLDELVTAIIRDLGLMEHESTIRAN